MWWTSKIAKKHSLRTAGIQARDLGESQAAKSVGWSCFLFSLFLPLHVLKCRWRPSYVFKGHLLCKQVRLSNIAKQQYLPFSIFSGVASLYQLLRDALVSEFPGHKHLSANESQELCAFSQHLCNTKINLFSVWQCCSGGTEGPIQDPTLVAADPEKHRWSCLLQSQHTEEANAWSSKVGVCQKNKAPS